MLGMSNSAWQGPPGILLSPKQYLTNCANIQDKTVTVAWGKILLSQYLFDLLYSILALLFKL